MYGHIYATHIFFNVHIGGTWHPTVGRQLGFDLSRLRRRRPCRVDDGDPCQIWAAWWQKAHGVVRRWYLYADAFNMFCNIWCFSFFLNTKYWKTILKLVDVEGVINVSFNDFILVSDIGKEYITGIEMIGYRYFWSWTISRVSHHDVYQLNGGCFGILYLSNWKQTSNKNAWCETYFEYSFFLALFFSLFSIPRSRCIAWVIFWVVKEWKKHQV